MRLSATILAVLLFASFRAASVDITVNLVNAETGSWTRRRGPHSHTQTEYVAAAAGDSPAAVITLQLLTHPNGLPQNKCSIVFANTLVRVKPGRPR